MNNTVQDFYVLLLKNTQLSALTDQQVGSCSATLYWH